MRTPVLLLRNILCNSCFGISYDKPIIRNIVKIMKPKDYTLGVPARIRSDPAVLKINSPEFQSIFTDELRDLIKVFDKYNYELRIAGGAVRDILMEIKPKDVDFATTATPDEMKDMFTKENIRMINTKGEKHGTITPRINNKENFEVTTLRIDLRTDGRHAEVEFTKDWQLDANRRDLTINSMFLGFDGTLYDYFYGFEDLKERKVAFVGDADIRIKEDYLRILRYFRFYGRIAKGPNSHDPETLQVIKSNADGLKNISGERIWSELRKIVIGNYNKELMLEFLKCDLGVLCGLPKNPNLEEFQRLCDEIKMFEEPHQSILFVIALLNDSKEAMDLHGRLKLSAYERDLALFITQNRDKVGKELQNDLDYKKIIVTSILPAASIKEYVLQLLKYKNQQELYLKLKDWTMPKLSIDMDIINQHNFAKHQLREVIKEIKIKWTESKFTLNVEEILAKHLPEITANVEASCSSPRLSKKVKKN